MKKKKLFEKKNTQKNEKILPFNCEKAIQTQRNKIHNNKGISLQNINILSYHNGSHSKGKNSTKLDSINMGNINSNQILPSNKIKIKNINFDNFRNRKFLKNTNNKNNKIQMDQNEVFNLTNDNIKYNNPLLNMKKFLSKINSIDFNQKSLFYAVFLSSSACFLAASVTSPLAILAISSILIFMFSIFSLEINPKSLAIESWQ